MNFHEISACFRTTRDVLVLQISASLNVANLKKSHLSDFYKVFFSGKNN